MSVWMALSLIREFDKECQKLGLNRSIVLRQLIKSWLVRRKLGGRKERFEEVA